MDKMTDYFFSMDFVYNFFIVFLCIDILAVVGACKDCTNQDFTKVQLLCGKSNQELVNAQNQFSEQNQHLLCNYLFEFYYCVGENVPVCLQKITSSYISYYSSPYDCHPDENVTLKLQNYMMKANDCSTKLQKPSTHSSKIDDSTVKYNVITTLGQSNGGTHNSLNGTNVAAVNVSPPGTFLLAFSWIISRYLDVV